MTPQERELTVSFLQQLTQAQVGQKDSEADALIREACARQPEAVYLLVQRAIALDVALQATQAQVAKLQAQLDQVQPDARGGFLDSSNAWGKTAATRGATPPSSTPAASSYAPARSAPQAPLAPQAPSAPPARASSWGSGMLGNVATTAAGVVAGSFLFQGIQGLMGHHNPGANPLADSVPQPDHEYAVDHDRAIDQQVADSSDTSDNSSDYTDSDDSSLGDTDSI